MTVRKKTEKQTSGRGSDKAPRTGKTGNAPGERAKQEADGQGGMLAQIMDAASMAIFLVDRSGRITHANKRMAEMFGRELRELAGCEYVELVHPAEREEGRRKMLALLASEIPSVDLERRYWRKDGSAFWGHLVGRRFHDARGADIGLIGVITDIDDRRKAVEALRESEAKYRRLYNETPVMFHSIDQNGILVDANDYWFETMGYTRDEVIGRPVVDIYTPASAKHAKEVIQPEFFRTGSVRNVAYQFVKKNGEVIDVLLSATGERDAGGRVVRSQAVIEDVTARKRMQEALQKSEKMLQTIFDAEPACVKLLDKDANLILMNRAGLDMLEVDSLDQVRGQCVCPMVASEYQEEFRDLTRRVFQGESGTLRFEMRGFKGRRLWMETHAAPLRNEKNEITALLGVTRDVTDRKRAEDALRQSEEKFRSIFDQATDGIMIAEVETKRFIEANAAICAMLGYTRDELVRLGVADIHPREHLSAVVQVFERQLRRELTLAAEIPILRKDGSVFYADINSTPIMLGGKQCLIGMFRDISERKSAEIALRESEKRLRTLIDAIPDAVFFKNAAGVHIIANSANERIYGISAEAMVGKTVEDLLPPGFAAVCRRNDDEVLKNRVIVRSEESADAPDGCKHILDTIKVPLYDDSGKAMGLVGIARDITEAKRAEEKIRENEQFIRSILDTVDEGFIVIGRDYRIVTANKAYCSQAGMPCGEVIGRHCYEISHRTARPCYEEGEGCAVREAFADGESHMVVHEHRDGEGRMLFVETKSFPIKDRSGAVVSVIETINNITEKRLLEEERLKTQKLESIGTLAGGIAHDFNNLLQGIFGYISLARTSLDHRQKAETMLEQAEKALHRSVSLTNQLLTFSKGGKPVKKVLALRPVIEDAVGFALSGSRVTADVSIAGDLMAVDADEGQIGQVLQNIVLNAEQAMPLGGRIQVTVRNGEAAAGGAGPHVVITVADQGIGIPAEHIPRIFDPYFTTKEKGSGLGLATSYSIIRNHGGDISVSSKLGRGSAFTIRLPGTGSTAAAKPLSGPATGRRGLRVLVMDDEEVVLMVAGELLRTLEHDAGFAENGETAIRMYREACDAGKAYDVVILDLTIRGGMGGVETLRALKKIDPNVKAVMSSGYSDDSSVADHRDAGFSAFLKKPYDLTRLDEVLSDLTE